MIQQNRDSKFESQRGTAAESLELFRGIHVSTRFTAAAAHEAFAGNGTARKRVLSAQEAAALATDGALARLEAMQQVPSMYRWVQFHAIWCAYRAADYGCHPKVFRFVRQAHDLIAHSADAEAVQQFLERLRKGIDVFGRQMLIRKQTEHSNLKRWQRNYHVLAMIEGALAGVPSQAPRQLEDALRGTSADVPAVHAEEMRRVCKVLTEGGEPYGRNHSGSMRDTLPEVEDLKLRRRLVQRRLR